MDILDIGLYIGYFLIVVAILVGLVMPLIQLVKSPASLKETGIAVGSIVVLAIIAYVVSSPAVTALQASIGVTPLESRLIGTGLILLYIVLTLAIIALIYSEIHKATK